MGSAREEVKDEPEYKISQGIRDAIGERLHSFKDILIEAQHSLGAYKPGSKRKEAHKKFQDSLSNAVSQRNTERFIALYNSAVSFPPLDNTEASIKAWEARNFCKYMPGIKKQLGTKRLHDHVNAIAKRFISRIRFFEQFKDDPNLVIAVLKDESLRARLDPEDIAEILKPWFDLEKRNTDEDREYRKQFRQILEKINFGQAKIIIPGFYQNRAIDTVSLNELIDLFPGEAKIDESVISFAQHVFRVSGNISNDEERAALGVRIGREIDDRIRFLTNDRMETALGDYLSKLPISYLCDFLSGSGRNMAQECVRNVCDQPAFSDVQRSDYVKSVLQAYDPEMVCMQATEIVEPHRQLIEKLTTLHKNYNAVFNEYDRISQGCGEEARRAQFEKRNEIMQLIGREIESFASKAPTQKTENEIRMCEQRLIQNFGYFINDTFEMFLEASETRDLYGFIPRLRLMLYQTFDVSSVRGGGPFFDSNAIQEINAGLVVEYGRFMGNLREYPFFKGRDSRGELARKYSIRMPCFVSEAANERPFADPEKPEHITPRSLTQFAARWKKACEVNKVPEPSALQRLIQAINDIEPRVADDEPFPMGWCNGYIKPILNDIETYFEIHDDKKNLTRMYVSRLSTGTISDEVKGIGLSLPQQQNAEVKITVFDLSKIVTNYDNARGFRLFSKSDGVSKIRFALDILTKKHKNNTLTPLDSDDVEMLRSVLWLLDRDQAVSKEKTPGTYTAREALRTLIADCEKNFSNEKRPELEERKGERPSSPLAKG